jgi:hypothetical protein
LKTLGKHLSLIKDRGYPEKKHKDNSQKMGEVPEKDIEGRK